MPNGVEQNSFVILTLRLGQRGPALDGVCNGRFEVVGDEVEMQHHLLLADA